MRALSPTCILRIESNQFYGSTLVESLPSLSPPPVPAKSLFPPPVFAKGTLPKRTSSEFIKKKKKKKEFDICVKLR